MSRDALFSGTATGLKSKQIRSRSSGIERPEISDNRIGHVEVSPCRHIDSWVSTHKLRMAQVGFIRVFKAGTTNFCASLCKRAGQDTELESYRQFRSLVDLIDESRMPRSVDPEPFHLGD